MAFAVGLPGGAPEYEFEAYVRMLEKTEGVDISDTLRIVDPTTGSRWVYAWEKEDTARAFVAALREDTENDAWQVYSLPGVEPTRGPLGPVDIAVTARKDGCTYALTPVSWKLVQKRFPQATLAPSVFISPRAIPFDFEKTQGPIWPQVALILTGLTEQQLTELGGFRVVDPLANRAIHSRALLAG